MVSLGIGLTSDCNLSCAHCYRNKDQIDNLTLNDIQSVCQSIPINSIGFGTGENGYDQLQTQGDILKLGGAVIPPMSQKQTKLTTLTVDGADLKWSKIAQIVRESGSGMYEMVNRHLEAIPR